MALPPDLADGLAAAADSILVGVVTRVSASDDARAGGFADRNYVLQLKVEAVEKGPRVEQATVRGWSALARPAGWSGPGGIASLSGLKAGDRVRIHARDSQLVEPDGLERLGAKPGAP